MRTPVAESIRLVILRDSLRAVMQARWAASKALCWAATVALAAATGVYKAACWLVSWARVVMGDGMSGSFGGGGIYACVLQKSKILLRTSSALLSGLLCHFVHSIDVTLSLFISCRAFM